MWTKSARQAPVDRVEVEVRIPPNISGRWPSQVFVLDKPEWTRTDAVLDVPSDATAIIYSVRTSGEMWIEQWPKVEIVGDDVALSHSSWPQALASSGDATAKIISIECGNNSELTVHFSINAPSGIIEYWFVDLLAGCDPNKDACDSKLTFAAPLPKSIDAVVKLRHADGALHARSAQGHAVYLYASVQGLSDPVLAFSVEPNGHCPGHPNLP